MDATVVVSENETKRRPQRKMPVKIEKLHLSGDFEGWWFVARINPKMELFNMLMRGTYDGMVTALSQLTVGEWNFVDENGEPLPQPDIVKENYEQWQQSSDGDRPISPQELIGKLTIDLVIQMGQVVGEKVQEVPGN